MREVRELGLKKNGYRGVTTFFHRTRQSFHPAFPPSQSEVGAERWRPTMTGLPASPCAVRCALELHLQPRSFASIWYHLLPPSIRLGRGARLAPIVGSLPVAGRGGCPFPFVHPPTVRLSSRDSHSESLVSDGLVEPVPECDPDDCDEADEDDEGLGERRRRWPWPLWPLEALGFRGLWRGPRWRRGRRRYIGKSRSVKRGPGYYFFSPRCACFLFQPVSIVLFEYNAN